MRSSPGQKFMRLLAWLCAVAGFLAWMGVAWRAFSEMDNLTPQSEVGGATLVWGTSGTLLMILGVLILHVTDECD